MDTPLEKNVRRNSIIVALLIVMIILGILTLIPSYSLTAISAIAVFTIAIVLPIRQKRFSLYSVFFIIIGILFLLSGVIENAANDFLNAFSVSSQIEFSKILRPRQISMGLWNVAVGICNTMLAWSWWTAFKNRPPQSKLMIWSSIVLGVLGVLFIIRGVSSIVNGLSRL